MNEETTYTMDLTTDEMQNIFGERDSYVKKIEKDLDVSIINRDGIMKITGTPSNAKKAVRLLSELCELSKRGNKIVATNVNYGIELAKEDKICKECMGDGYGL